MSFLYDVILPGTSSAFVEQAYNPQYGRKTLRKSQSHNGLFAPLRNLVRNPVRTLGDAFDGLGTSSEGVPASPLDQDSRKQLLNFRMKNAEFYEDWKSAATELDILEGNEAWKLQDESPEYDYALISARLNQLDDARTSCDVGKMLFLVRTSLTRGLGGMGDLRLYKHSHIGTKALIERYIESVLKALTALLEISAKQGDDGEMTERKLLDSLLATRQSFGRSALLLSGGATFGMNHIGVVKTLWQARLLPRIISGASAGSIVCAVLCTKTDAEMPEVLRSFCYGDLAVFEKEGDEDGMAKKAARFLKYGSLFDIAHLTRVMRNMLGDITFQEAYNRTRRILNITVSSASLYELPRLLNYVTAPNVMIWSAVCASCSVPFVFSPASLLAKDPKTGNEVPWDPIPNGGWIDGSVDNDLPMTRLAEMFNVNHFIVSQVNPHVVPFLVRQEEKIGAEVRNSNPSGSNWIDNLAQLAKGETLHRLHVLAELGVFPNYLTKARSILNQRYSGDITIFPAISYSHFPKILSNPTTEFMLQCMLNGERATWPKLSRVKNHVAIELALDETIQLLRARVVFSPSQIDLRFRGANRPSSLKNGAQQEHRRPRPRPKFTRFDTETAHSSVPSSVSSSHGHHPHFRLPLCAEHHDRKPYLPIHPMSTFSRSNVRSGQINETHLAPPSHLHPDLTSDTDTPESDSSAPQPSPSPLYSPAAPPLSLSASRDVFQAAGSDKPHVFSHRHSSSSLYLNFVTGAKKGQASPEMRYKALFHPGKADRRDV